MMSWDLAVTLWACCKPSSLTATWIPLLPLALDICLPLGQEARHGPQRSSSGCCGSLPGVHKRCSAQRLLM